MIQIYHNKRCSKSREGVQFLIDNNLKHEIIYYLETPLNFEQISEIIKKLNIKPIELIRTKEKTWTSTFKNKVLTNEAIISAMVEFPNLIERPIVINKNKAVIARPTEKINNIL